MNTLFDEKSFIHARGDRLLTYLHISVIKVVHQNHVRHYSE